MSGQHTPGPWFFVERIGGYTHIDGDGCFQILDRENEQQANVLCTRQPWPEKQAEMVANARLIAAAPELLEALRGYVEEHKKHNEGLLRPYRDASDTRLEAALAAIAKATASTTDAGVVG